MSNLDSHRLDAADPRVDDPLGLIGAQIESLPSLSPSISQILAALDSENSDAQDVAELMASDLAIAGRILKMANSVFYNPGGMSSANVGDAIARLGFDQVRRIVSTIGVVGAFDDVDCPFDYLAFWRHSLTSAIAAGALASRASGLEASGPSRSNPYFVSGLMHDVGIFVFVLCKGKQYQSVLERAQRDEAPLDALEREVFGVGHPEVGAALLRSWRLPKTVSAACEFHHHPARAPESLRSWVEIIHLADWITDHEGLGLSIEGNLGRFREGAWHDIGVAPDEIPSVIAEFVEAAEQSKLMVSLAG